MQRDLLLNAIVRIQKSCPDKSKCQDKHHITAVFFSSASNWRKSFFLVKMHFRYAMPDVLIFLKLLRFALLEQFLDDACSIALPRYIMLTILSENWLLHFEKLESTFPMLLMEKVEYAKLYFILLTSQDDFVNILSTEKYVEYSERTLIERKWKEKMIVCRHTWYSELVGVTSIFFWPGHNYTRERGRAPSLSFKCSENIWSGINIWWTGWSLKTVDCIFFLTDPKISESAITQWSLESLYRFFFGILNVYEFRMFVFRAFFCSANSTLS